MASTVCATARQGLFIAKPNGACHLRGGRGVAAAAPYGQADRRQGWRLSGDRQPDLAAARRPIPAYRKPAPPFSAPRNRLRALRATQRATLGTTVTPSASPPPQRYWNAIKRRLGSLRRDCAGKAQADADSSWKS